MHRRMPALLLLGLMLSPLAVLAQSDGSAPPSDSPPAESSVPATPSDMPAAEVATSSAATVPARPAGAEAVPAAAVPRSAPTAAPAVSTSSPAAAVAEPLAATSAPTETAPADTDSTMLLWAVLAVLAILPFGFLAARAFQKQGGEKKEDCSRCLDIKKLLDKKLKELTDIRGRIEGKVKDMAKEQVREALKGTATGEALALAEQAEKEYNRLKKLYEECMIEFEGNKIAITYFVHGTTTDNEQDLSTGWLPGELSEVGIRQARELGEQVKDKTFDVVFCSDLKRAVDSARLAFGETYEIVPDARLRECNYGDLNGAKDTFKDGKMKQYVDVAFPNGESYKDVEKRMADFLSYIQKEYAGKHIAIVAHQGPQLALDVLLRGRTWQQAIDEDWRNTRSWKPGWDYAVD